jgi:hypothetical protein
LKPEEPEEYTMRQASAIAVTTLLLMTLAPMLSTAQSLLEAEYPGPVTPWGHPDLQGVWDRRTITPLERPARFANKAFLSAEEILAYEQASAARGDGRPLDFGRSGLSVHDPADLDYGSKVLVSGQTSLIVDPADGKIPAFTQSARQRATLSEQAREERGTADSWLDRSLQERCITWGIPQGMLPQAYNNNIQIVQTERAVLILNEMVHDIRIVPLDGRPHLPDSIRQWHGDPRGYWEGNTLVVESRNFSAKTNFQGASENLRLTERFTRIGENVLQYGFTVEDPDTWVRPWTVSFPMLRGEEPMYEFACHEGNYGLQYILQAARVLERQSGQ